MTDLQRLAAACRAEPDEDTPRLLLADALQEAEPVRVTCPKCSPYYPGKVYHYAGPDSEYGTCHYCTGTGTVIDPTREQWAELIRVQCELAKHPRRVVLDSDADGKGVLLSKRGGPDYYELPWETAFYYGLKVGDRVDVLRRKGDNDPKWLRGLRVTKVNSDEDSDTILRRDAESGPDPVAHLRTRESTLLASLARCRPKCPACKGTKLAPDSEQVGNVPVICSACLHPSELCSTGRLPLTWHRGGASCKVPRLEDVWHRVSVFPEADAPKVWQPTPLGRELAALPLLVGVECMDRVPESWVNGHKPRWSWFLDGLHDDGATLPEPVFDALRGWDLIFDGRKAWYAEDAARAALAAAVAESLCEWSQ